jgi:hypothetical protein
MSRLELSGQVSYGNVDFGKLNVAVQDFDMSLVHDAKRYDIKYLQVARRVRTVGIRAQIFEVGASATGVRLQWLQRTRPPITRPLQHRPQRT